jgi:hypothetical protein
MKRRAVTGASVLVILMTTLVVFWTRISLTYFGTSESPANSNLALTCTGPFYHLPSPQGGRTNPHAQIHVLRGRNRQSSETEFVVLARGCFHTVDMTIPTQVVLNEDTIDLSPIAGTRSVYYLDFDLTLRKSLISIESLELELNRFDRHVESTLWREEISPNLASLSSP